MVLTPGPEKMICSRRECIFPARWAVCWKNPRIHREREKIWLSCPEHRPYFEDYFSYRNFPFRVIDIRELEGK
ncbi:MAG: hypothetical protein Q4P66_03685 [Actinomycetaceae bacterium]|nr:hypothetical protein [Actinomycetaceae bacterium]